MVSLVYPCSAKQPPDRHLTDTRYTKANGAEWAAFHASRPELLPSGFSEPAQAQASEDAEKAGGETRRCTKCEGVTGKPQVPVLRLLHSKGFWLLARLARGGDGAREAEANFSADANTSSTSNAGSDSRLGTAPQVPAG